MRIVYENESFIVLLKPIGCLSSDGPNGVAELVRAAKNDPELKLHLVHRLDREVGGLMVLAKTGECAAELSRCIVENRFDKEYLAVISGIPEDAKGEFRDLLFHDREKNRTYVVKRLRKGVKEAALEYEVLQSVTGFSLVKIHLLTGRTHQIRVQFASRKLPLIGDRKYGSTVKAETIALWSHKLSFGNDKFSSFPPEAWPWTLFPGYTEQYDTDEVTIK